MKITLLGAGNMASGFAQRIARTSHSLTIRGRDAAKAAALARSTGAATGEQGVADADVVIVATGFQDAIAALSQAGDLTGKTVVDITNPMKADFSGLAIGFSTSAAEEIQKAFPKAHVVKAFNTLFAQVLAAGTTAAGAPSVFIAADDAGAKERVKTLATDLGFKPVDAGALNNARLLEPLAALNIYLGYGAGHGTAIAPTWAGL